METMEVKKKARAQNWTAEEEVLLIEEVKARAEILFGPLKGCGKSGKIKEIKDREWQMVADKLNSQFDNKMRGLEEAKKKYYNIKQRSKEKLDSVKKPKTGGGPPLPPLTPGEETFLNLSVGQPNVHGLNGGVDSDVKGTKTHTGSTISASNNRVGQKTTVKQKANQLVLTRTYFSNSFRESKKPEPDRFSKDYSDGVGKEYHLVYALHNFDTGYRFFLGLCVSVPLIFLQRICSYIYQYYNELEYTSNSLQGMLSNCIEIINSLPPSYLWIFTIAYITLIGTIGHHVFVKNSIGRLYYNSKQDHYTAIVFKYGFKRKIEFSRKDIVRKPVFFEKVIQKTGITVGEKKRYFVYEKYFKNTVDNNRFFSEVASSDYLDEINRSHRSKPK